MSISTARPAATGPSRGRRSLAAAGAVLGAALLLSGCGLRSLASPAQEKVQTYDVGGRLTMLKVDSGSGAIVVDQTGRSGVRVTETVHWTDDPPRTRHPVDGGTLTLDYDCPRDEWRCGVDYKIEIPRDLRVDLHTGSGDITLRAVSGELKAVTGSGEIGGSALTARRASAETGSGDVELRFATAPGTAELRTGSGSAIVRVPQDTYDVTARTGSGQKVVEVGTSASATRRIVVQTGSGDAKVLKG
ncbi:hypothetical protein Sru01_32850 [Sphaerisporangium rufum]|uniref:DUF4097 domain-containing protein n=1 Tax=Sphaerisporangium rufum TaxID=1381558 RepID=A0A919R2W1_9ACTN|nr:DUF4097 family beta strand repeat-containing protein [Sphaerisporangium rufum]GII78303.1 hypothetical protein Sru01_32850 [Sphaerisporangium rufum]